MYTCESFKNSSRFWNGEVAAQAGKARAELSTAAMHCDLSAPWISNAEFEPGWTEFAGYRDEEGEKISWPSIIKGMIFEFAMFRDAEWWMIDTNSQIPGNFKDNSRIRVLHGRFIKRFEVDWFALGMQTVRVVPPTSGEVEGADVGRLGTASTVHKFAAETS